MPIPRGIVALLRIVALRIDASARSRSRDRRQHAHRREPAFPRPDPDAPAVTRRKCCGRERSLETNRVRLIRLGDRKADQALREGRAFGSMQQKNRIRFPELVDRGAVDDALRRAMWRSLAAMDSSTGSLGLGTMFLPGRDAERCNHRLARSHEICARTFGSDAAAAHSRAFNQKDECVGEQVRL
jgi:hypothetical protein